jgi:hypothetical protein
MNHDSPPRADIADLQRQAETLFAALSAGDSDAQWRVKLEHPRFSGKTVDEVKAERLDLDDARLVVAQQESFDTWADLDAFVAAMSQPGAVARFEAAVDAVVSGDLATLQSMLREHPALVRERSARRHHATLLHYTAANGTKHRNVPGHIVSGSRSRSQRGTPQRSWTSSAASKAAQWCACPTRSFCE